jgi:hypothetical protein
MVDMTETEAWAITKAGQVGGEYLDELRITDLSRLTMGQYSVYVRCIVSSYLGEIARLQGTPTKDGVPF